MRALVLAVCMLDLALAGLCFVLLARPEALLASIAAWVGEGQAWEEGRLDAAARDRLLRLARRAQIPALFALFGWSYLCGAALTWLRV